VFSRLESVDPSQSACAISGAIRALGLQTIAPAKISPAGDFAGKEPLPRRQELCAPARRMAGRSRKVQENKVDMANGTVKWFNSAKGFGFIQPDDGGKDVFVHVSAVERAGLRGLNEGQKIGYELQAERGRTAAVNLKEL
jgi:cold shock protein